MAGGRVVESIKALPGVGQLSAIFGEGVVTHSARRRKIFSFGDFFACINFSLNP